MKGMEYNANPQPEDSKFLNGAHNKGIRLYFYLMRGLDVLNSFRNLFLGIGALYLAMHLDNLFYAALMFVVSSIILIAFGYYSVHKLSKVNEWLTMRFSTHFGMKTFNYTEKQTQLLEEILKELKKKELQ